MGRAGKDSQEATKKVNEILADVESIMKELKDLPDINDEQLNLLEEELFKAENRVREAELDKILEDLRREQKEQNSLVETYNVEIERLRAEVENVRDIANALPPGCFNRVELEP